jgi:hypothetical protein
MSRPTHVEGYIVEGPEGHFLNQTRTEFIPQDDEGTPHVHRMEELANCLNRREWSKTATQVYFSRWSPVLGLSSKVEGMCVPFSTFACCLDATARAA